MRWRGVARDPGERVQRAGRVGAILFLVRDTGIGMDSEQQAKVFDEFEQADATISREYGGTGLGLALVTRLTGLLGGTVGVESALGEGSTFPFTR